jgi:hypothetical protein
MSITTRAPYGLELEYMPLDAFGGAGPHKLNPIAYSLMHKQPTLHGGGGGNVFKAVVAVAAAVAVPYFAPQIAASIGLSGAVSSALAGTALAGASGAIAGGIVGAALGAVTAKVTGQDAGRGALFGAIGGGISGYQGINSATGALNPATGTAAAGSQAPVATGGAPSGFTSAYNVETGAYDVVNLGTGDTVRAGLDAQAAADLGAQLSGTAGPSYQMGTQTFDDGSSIQTLSDGSTITTNTEGQIVSTTPAVQGAEGAGLNTATAPTTPAAPTTAPSTAPQTAPTSAPQTAGSQGSLGERLVSGVQKAGSELVKNVTDPKKQADFLLRAAGQIAGTYLAPDGMSDEEKQLLDKQRQELETLRTTNQELFKEKLDAARQLVQDANYFDPEYFGLQRARQVQQAGARVERETLGKIPQARAGLRAAEQRRIRLGTGRDVGTAYDTGFTAAVDAQNRSRTAGLNLYPSTANLSTMGYAQNLASMYGVADERKRRAIKETQGLFGTILG